MTSLPLARNEWPIWIGPDCPAEDFRDCADRGMARLRRAAIGLAVALLIVAGAASLLSGKSLAFNATDLTFEERANVMTAQEVATTIMTGSDKQLLDEFVAPEATISFPGGSFSGPQGAGQLSEILTEPDEYHAFAVLNDEVDGQNVTLTWKLEGPIYPGSLVWTSVPEGSAISGEMLLKVDRGLVYDLQIIVNS